MKFTKKAEYAVILASELAFCQNNRSLREISEHSQISYALLRKVAHEMSIAGLIRGEEGKNGGYSLARQPEEINLKEILAAIDEPLVSAPCCFGEKSCSGSAVCPRNSVLYALQGAMDEIFGVLTLEKLIKGDASCMKMWKR